MLVIAPLSANTLAKVATGLADNLLVRAGPKPPLECGALPPAVASPSCACAQTCVARAWNFSKPFLVAPAMNTDMWNHPITARQLGTLAEFGCTVLPPVAKKLACNAVGMGALRPVDSIVDSVLAASGGPSP